MIILSACLGDGCVNSTTSGDYCDECREKRKAAAIERQKAKAIKGMKGKRKIGARHQQQRDSVRRGYGIGDK